MPSSLEFKVIEFPTEGRPYLVFRFPQKTKRKDKFSYHYFVEVKSTVAVEALAGIPPKAEIPNGAWNGVWDGTYQHKGNAK